MSRSKNFNTKYSPEFKISVIIDMRENGLSYKATMRKYFPQFPPKNYPNKLINFFVQTFGFISKIYPTGRLKIEIKKRKYDKNQSFRA